MWRASTAYEVVIAGSASRGTRFEIAVFLIARAALWVGAGVRRILLVISMVTPRSGRPPIARQRAFVRAPRFF